MNRKIAIIGAGQIGLLFGAQLTAAGLKPVIYGHNEADCQQLGAAPVTVSGVRELQVSLQPVTRLEGLFDYILVCTKALANQQLAEWLPGHLAPEGVVACMQNGLAVENAFFPALGRQRVLRGVLNFSSLRQGNHLTMSYMKTSYLGCFEAGYSAAGAELVQIINEAGISMAYSEKIADKTWEKVLLGVPISVVAAVTGQTIAGVLDCRPSCQLALKLFDELLQVASSRHFAEPDNFLAYFLEYNQAAGNHRPSLAVDVANGRASEAPFYTGKALEFARQAQLSVPVLETINQILKAIDYKNS